MTTTEDVEARKKLWIEEQEQLKSKLITHDTEEWQRNRILTRVGGLDISFVKDHPEKAYCTLVILSIPNLNVIYEDSFEVQLTAPYIAGFLAFREVEHCLKAYHKLIQQQPELTPQVILFDGNGIFHPRGLGLASHFGVLANIPTVGVAKNLYQMDNILRDDSHKIQINSLVKVGDWFPITSKAGEVLAVALKTSATAKPVYVSVGHKIGLETAVWTVIHCAGGKRIPEPTRQADIRSRVVARSTGNNGK